MSSRISFAIVLSLAVASFVGAQAPVNYTAIEVVAFEAAKGVDFPPDFQAKLMDELVKQLTETRKYAQVMREGETAADPSAPTLKLTGVVTSVDEGSRAARVLVGWGAGKAEIKAHLKVIDAKTGEVEFDSDVKASMSGGWGGGESINVAKNLAKNIVKFAKQRKF